MILSFLGNRVSKFLEFNEKNVFLCFKGKIIFNFEVNSNYKYLSLYNFLKLFCKCGINFKVKSMD